MNYQSVYVIRDGEGNYISPRQTKKGWYYVAFTGIVTGFTFYASVEVAQKEMDALNGLGDNFYLDIIDLNSIPRGKRVDISYIYL
jgi:hypothetical protein